MGTDGDGMAQQTVRGVYLGTDDFDLGAFYGPCFAGYEPEVVIATPEETPDPAEVRFAMCWLPDPGVFSLYPNLELLCVPGAGVDGLLNNPGLPPHAAICRLRDPDQAAQMAGFALHEVLHVERGFAQLAEDQLARRWAPVPARAPSEVVIAVLGYGSMGSAVARGFAALGFSVRVASRTAPAEQIPDVQYFSGGGAIGAAVEDADYVINVLPLTAATRGILNSDLFGRMARGSWLVQIGRGEHLDESDLIAALESGQLAGASLDVFEVEPLPRGHRFWTDPRLRLSPHVASIASPVTAARQIVQSVREMRDGHALSLAIERARGY